LVVLWTEKGNPVLETRANERGEFELEFEAQAQLRISIELAGRTPIRIPLANLTEYKLGTNEITNGTKAGYQ
jgi:hypothetical protein